MQMPCHACTPAATDLYRMAAAGWAGLRQLQIGLLLAELVENAASIALLLLLLLLLLKQSSHQRKRSTEAVQPGPAKGRGSPTASGQS